MFSTRILAASLLSALGSSLGLPVQPTVKVKVVEGGESARKPAECRGTVVGPGVNQPDPFPGYGGFVGWESPLRLKNGTWLVGFSAGYWHASPPTPLRFPAKTLEENRKLGMPTNWNAPTGGRAMIVRSNDEGKTWSKPETIIDTPADDRSTSLLELPDGTILCSFFTYAGEGDVTKDPSLATHVWIIRSFDGGRTWEEKPRRLPSPFLGEASDGPMVLRKDGSVLLTVYGEPAGGGPSQAGLFTTKDRGETWELLSVIKADHNLDEAHTTELPNGRLVMIARPEGDISWSDDGGRTWTRPVAFGMRMYAPSLYVLRDGTLLCLHGSYAPGAGGFRAIFSRDGGGTWVAPSLKFGFLVDTSYGYGKGMELPDGSIYAVHLSTGGHKRKDAQTNSIYSIRLRVRPDHSGIDLLPAPERGEKASSCR